MWSIKFSAWFNYCLVMVNNQWKSQRDPWRSDFFTEIPP